MLLRHYGRKSKGFECLLGSRERLKNFAYYSVLSRVDSERQCVILLGERGNMIL